MFSELAYSSAELDLYLYLVVHRSLMSVDGLTAGLLYAAPTPVQPTESNVLPPALAV
jgi:hypothetical protein